MDKLKKFPRRIIAALCATAVFLTIATSATVATPEEDDYANADYEICDLPESDETGANRPLSP